MDEPACPGCRELRDRRHTMRYLALISLGVSVVACISNASATTYDFSSRPGFILQGKAQVLVQSSTTTARLYDLKGQILQTFELGERVAGMDVSPDDRFVVLSSKTGRVRIWRIADGTVLAERHAGKISFSPDASLFCFASDTGIDIYRTDDGSPVRQCAVGGGVDALQLSGEIAFKLGDDFQELDLRSGRVTSHKGKGARPLVLTADGRWALCREYNRDESWRGKQFLRVWDTKTGRIVADRGPLDFINRIRAARDGTARITVVSPADSPDGKSEAGYRYDPTEHAVKELWRVQRDNTVRDWASDFDPEQGLGVTTDVMLESRVFRLKTGETVLTIPRIGEHRLEMLSTSSRGGDESSWRPLWLALGATVIVLTVVALIWWFRSQPA
jgi:WD40 repeat protein